MSNAALPVITVERRVTTITSNLPMWRYLGERAAADLAYCARFNVNEAPEPIKALGGGLDYSVPTRDLRV